MNNQEHIKLLHQGEAFFSVALVGFPGSGKTTVGKQLARALQYEFLDMDILFGQRYEVPVNLFMKKYGETMFRKCEYDLLTEIVEKPYMEAVIEKDGEEMKVPRFEWKDGSESIILGSDRMSRRYILSMEEVSS